MLRMAQVQYIKDLYENEEKSLREISRITGHSFETVQKYAQKENWNEDNLPDTEPTSYPVLGEFIPIVDGWLEADRKVPRKQRHTAWRLFCRLRDEYGFRGSYSSVKRYVRKKKYVMNVQSAGFLPLERTPGCGQVDFGEFLYYDAGGQEQKGYALTISFPHSNMGYTQAFPSQNQECLLEGMKRIFEHMGGVPPRLRFDNMTTAVAQVLRGTERFLTEGFSRFMLHYRFQAEFCNPASGNEKGNVENKVGYSRRNAFVPVPTITSFEKFNEEYLWGWCEKDAQRDHYIHKVPILELWQADADALLNLPDYPFTVFRYSTLTVSKTGFVVIDTNRYGLPGKWCRPKSSLTTLNFSMTTMPLVVSGAVTSRMMKSMTGRSMWQPFAKSPEQWKTPGSSTRCRNNGRLTWPPHKAKSARTPYNFSAKS